MNDLVAIDRGDRGIPDWGTVGRNAFPVVDRVFDSAEHFQSGNWDQGIISYGQALGDLVAFALDPLGELMSSVVGFLIDYMPPLPQLMDWLVGNPDLVASIGTTWGNVGEHLRQTADDLARQGLDCVRSWSGEAAEAFKQALSKRVDILHGLGYAGLALDIGFRIASVIVEIVRSVVTDLVADLVGRLLAWAAEIAFTFGIGASWVVPRAVPTINSTIQTVTGFTDNLDTALNQGMNAMEELSDAISVVSMAIDALVAGSDRVTS